MAVVMRAECLAPMEPRSCLYALFNNMLLLRSKEPVSDNCLQAIFMFLYPDGYNVYRIIVYGIFLLRRSNGLSILVGPVSDLTLLSHYSYYS